MGSADCVAVLTAAGSSARMGPGPKKEYRDLGGQSVLAASLRNLSASGIISSIVITHPPGGLAAAKAALPADLSPPPGIRLLFAEGGRSRRASVLRGLEALAVGGDPAIVLIHDAARPWASPDLARRVAKAAREHGAALPLVPSRDTLKEADPSGMVAAHLKRSRVMAAQTPQGFDFWRILRAHRAAEEAIVAGEVDDAFTDDTEVWAAFGEGAVAWVEGEETNLKITYAGDL